MYNKGPPGNEKVPDEYFVPQLYLGSNCTAWPIYLLSAAASSKRQNSKLVKIRVSKLRKNKKIATIR